MRATLALKEKMKDFEKGRNNWVEPLRSWILDTKQADFLAKDGSFSELKSFVQKIGTNHTVRNKTVHFSVSAPSAFVAQKRHLLPLCTPSARRPSTLSAREVSICGETGIRTLGPLEGGHRFSRATRSTTPAPLRKIY